MRPQTKERWYTIYAFRFTEQGVAMLSSSKLNSESAIEINISIMRFQVTVRQYLSLNSNKLRKSQPKQRNTKMLKATVEDTIAAVNDL